MALFGTHDKVIDFILGFNFIHQVTDILESDEQIADTADTIFSGDFLNQ